MIKDRIFLDLEYHDVASDSENHELGKLWPPYCTGGNVGPD